MQNTFDFNQKLPKISTKLKLKGAINNNSTQLKLIIIIIVRTLKQNCSSDRTDIFKFTTFIIKQTIRNAVVKVFY